MRDNDMTDAEWQTQRDHMTILGLSRLRHPLPYFAEYPYFLWGEVNYDSEGDCACPTDQGWTSLRVANRQSNEFVMLYEPVALPASCEMAAASPSAELAWLAAYLTAVRTGGMIYTPDSDRMMDPDEIAVSLSGLPYRLAAADAVREMFQNPDLAPFDSHAWWGGWKWHTRFASDMTAPLRATMLVVQEGEASEELIAWLQVWWGEPPAAPYVDGVRQAIWFATGIDPAGLG